MVSAKPEFYYFLEFTNVAPKEASKDVCHKPHYRSQTKNPFGCSDTSTGSCDDDNIIYSPDPSPCKHSSMMTVLSDDQKMLYYDDYDEVGCKPENFIKRNRGQTLDTCRTFNDYPSCVPEGFDACSIRFNQTSTGDANCGGCKDCVCFDGDMFSLSPIVPE